MWHDCQYPSDGSHMQLLKMASEFSKCLDKRCVGNGFEICRQMLQVAEVSHSRQSFVSQGFASEVL